MWSSSLTFWPQGHFMSSDFSALVCMSSKLGVDGARWSHFSWRAQTRGQTDRDTYQHTQSQMPLICGPCIDWWWLGNTVRCKVFVCSVTSAVQHGSVRDNNCAVIKLKFSHTRYQALDPKPIPVYRQSACRWHEVNHAIDLAVKLPLFSTLPAVTSIAFTRWRHPYTVAHISFQLTTHLSTQKGLKGELAFMCQLRIKWLMIWVMEHRCSSTSGWRSSGTRASHTRCTTTAGPPTSSLGTARQPSVCSGCILRGIAVTGWCCEYRPPLYVVLSKSPCWAHCYKIICIVPWSIENITVIFLCTVFTAAPGLWFFFSTKMPLNLMHLCYCLDTIICVSCKVTQAL